MSILQRLYERRGTIMTLVAAVLGGGTVAATFNLQDGARVEAWEDAAGQHVDLCQEQIEQLNTTVSDLSRQNTDLSVALAALTGSTDISEVDATAGSLERWKADAVYWRNRADNLQRDLEQMAAMYDEVSAIADVSCGVNNGFPECMRDAQYPAVLYDQLVADHDRLCVPK